MAKTINKEYEQWFVDTLCDPSAWTSAFLRDPTDPQKPLLLRSYQDEVLQNTRTHRRMVLRYGRRMGKTVVFCADMLWWTIAKPLAEMYESKGTKQIPVHALILTPMDSQIKMIFDTLLDLCADSPMIKDMITKIKRSDVSEIHFKNGSIIKGMTIGISSGNKGTSIRGQSANYIFLDEVDYIPRDIIEESILPIFSTSRDCIIRACSTPSGRRDLYYDWCTRPELGWWHRHYASWHEDNPSWISIEQSKELGLPLAESTEFQFRSTTTAEAYAREYGAEFGEENQGVYKHDLLEKSMIKYLSEYNNYDADYFDPGFTQNQNNIYIIGVDWNTYRNGGQVVMMEYCKEPTYINYYDHDENREIHIDCTNKFRLFYRKGVKSKEATQMETRKEIIRLMNAYKVDHVYVDYGAGDTNIEELTFYGKNHPHLGMQRKLHVVDSGSTIEHYDPVLQKKIKKRAKSLMINQSVVGLEEGRMLLPKEEDSNHRLVYQMRNYIVKSVTVKGDFTYAGEDHVLDAFVLAVWGFYHQYSLLINTSYENKVRFMANPMMEYAPHRASENSVKSPILNVKQNIRDPEAPSYNLPNIVRKKSYSRGSNKLGTGFRSLF